MKSQAFDIFGVGSIAHRQLSASGHELFHCGKNVHPGLGTRRALREGTRYLWNRSDPEAILASLQNDGQFDGHIPTSIDEAVHIRAACEAAAQIARATGAPPCAAEA